MYYSRGVISGQRKMQRTVIFFSGCSFLEFLTASFLKVRQNLFILTTEAYKSSPLGEVVSSLQGGPQLEDNAEEPGVLRPGPSGNWVWPLAISLLLATCFCHLDKWRFGLDVPPSSCAL